MQTLVSSVAEMHFMKPDPRTMDLGDQGIEEEPKAAKADKDTPYIVKTKYRPPPIKVTKVA